MSYYKLITFYITQISCRYLISIYLLIKGLQSVNMVRHHS